MRNERRRTPAVRAVLLATLAAAGALSAYAATAPRTVSAAAQTGDCTPGGSWPAANGGLASQVMSLINQHRASIGEGQLVTSPTLTASAVWKARHMAAYNYFSHDDPGPPTAPTPARSAADRVATCGYAHSWGENIAVGYSSAQAVVNAWLNSAGHKANIENPSFVATGLGVAQSANGSIYWVQDFGVVADGGSPPPPPPTTTTTPAPPPPTTTKTTTSSTTTTSPSTSTTTKSPPATTTGQTTITIPVLSAGGALRLAAVHVHTSGHRLVLATHVSVGSRAPAGATVKCVAHVGTRALRVVVNAYHSQLARCAWRLPRRLGAKAVARGWVRVKEGGQHVRRSFRVTLR
jgi:uncharacterized protein YkwD